MEGLDMNFFLEKWGELWETVVQQTSAISTSIKDIPDVAIHDMATVGITLTVVAVLNLIFLLFKPARGRAKMTKEERRLYERRIISDAITDAIEDKVYRGEISDNTAQHWYFLIGHRCGLTDLFPKPPPKPTPPLPSVVKNQIRERLVHMWKTEKPLPTPTIEKPKTEKVLKFERRPAKSA